MKRASVQEAHLKRILNVVLVVAGISASVMVSPPKTVAVGAATREFHSVAVIYGLHVALPDDMRKFLAVQIPLP
jgi:hypothetical protein